MSFPARPIAFVLASTNHGNMIVNRNDYAINPNGNAFGVGYQLLSTSQFDANEIRLALLILDLRRRHFGDGVVAIDGGANIGVHTIEWSRHMYGWGQVMSFEAQETVYYALAGNIALNNCLNARARLAALGERCGEMIVPRPDYTKPASFGSLELRQREHTEAIGQPISYDAQHGVKVPVIDLPSLELERLDFLKLDVEGMEVDVLRGARAVIERHRPVMLIEMIKSDRGAIDALLTSLGYHQFPFGIDTLAIHESDPTLQHVQKTDDGLSIN
ncbi:FkbM family methyltransferase [Burkholderia sp. Ac-20365]|uniref:FkbM family methyltransferase n=1 Tax=Burkholderia sp. Ac-20365 TaxID=2703897 RepID=UPI00197C3368|nr:FkbM family methyltransferase [Burkholderia sp. Ac-20365]MBN3760180.1 FkbM family methyltransferase [Burkholderia sp. Ac-20365]